MKKIFTIALTMMLFSVILFGEEKVKFVERNRYMMDEHYINTNFVDFINNDVKGRLDVESLGYIDYGNIRCYHFNLMHSYTGYNRLSMYVSTENRILKTYLTHDNELAVITENEDWMRYVHINEGKFIVGEVDMTDKNWCERQMAWCYETFVPSQEFVDKCTPSKETMKTVGYVVLITGMVILIIFSAGAAMQGVVN